MSFQATASIIKHFSSIQEPRIYRQKLHEIENIFFITICAVICGADSWVSDLSSLTKGEVIAIDGKHVRRSHDKSSN